MKDRVRNLVMILVVLGVAIAWLWSAPQPFVMDPQDAAEPSAPATSEAEPVLVGDGVHDRKKVSPESGQSVLHVLVRDNYQQQLGGINVGLTTAQDLSVVVARGLTDHVMGEVSFALKAGKYHLWINTKGPGSHAYTPLKEPISVEQGTTVSIERTLRRYDASLRVIVQDDHGEFVPGLEVSVDASRYSRVSRTDSQGAAFFDGILPGEAVVRVKRSSATPLSVAVPGDLRKRLNLESGMNAPCIFVLVCTGALDTRLECDDERFDQSERIWVEWFPEDRSAYDHRSYPWQLVTLGKTVRVEHLPPGSYEVRYHFAAESVLIGPIDLQRVTVESGRVATYVAHAVPAAGVVSGRVIYNGLPVVGVGISVSWVSVGDSGGWHSREKGGETNKEGRFELRGLPVMPYSMNVASSYIQGKQEFAYFGSFEEPGLKLAGPTIGLEIELRPAAMLKGRVVNGRGKTVKAGEVVLNRARYDSESVVELYARGTFEFGHLRAGSYVLSYRRKGETLASRELQLDGAVNPVVEIKWNIEEKD